MLSAQRAPAATSMSGRSPDGLITAALLAVVSTAAFHYLIVLPLLVTELQTMFGLGPARVGTIISINAYVSVASTLATSFFIRRLSWRPVLIGALLILAGCEALTAGVHSLTWLIGVRIVDGCASGIVAAITGYLLGRTRLPDRTYGVLLVYQSAVGSLALFVLPAVVRHWGAHILFLTLAVATIASVAVIPFLPRFEEASASATPTTPRPWPTWRTTLVLALAAIYLFQTVHTSLISFVFDLGKALGLSISMTANGVGTGQVVGVIGSFIVIIMGLRFGRARPLLAVVPGVMVEALLLLAVSPGAVSWFAAQLVDNLVTFYALPLMLGICAANPRDGRPAIWAQLVSMLGAATGPALGGSIDQLLGIRPVVILAMVGMAGSGMLAAWAAGRLERWPEPVLA